MKVKAIKDFYDLKAKKKRKADKDIFEVSAARAKELTTVNNKSGEILCVPVEKEPSEEIKGAENAPA